MFGRPRSDSRGGGRNAMLRTTVLATLTLTLALLACKKGEATPTGDTKPAVATAAAATGQAPAHTTAAPTATSTGPSYKIGDVPDIPSTKSNPPQGTEWDQGVPVNTQGANSRAKRCSMHVLREWLRIYCSGKIIGYEKKEDFGELGSDYYEKIVAGKYASFVIRLKKGANQKIRICREGDRASLFVSWPVTADKPKHIALGQGPACDGSDWGAGYGKKGSGAFKAKPGEGPDETDPDIKALMEADRKAIADCAKGISDACYQACGGPKCD
jgi:hypothetical protein